MTVIPSLAAVVRVQRTGRMDASATAQHDFETGLQDSVGRTMLVQQIFNVDRRGVSALIQYRKSRTAKEEPRHSLQCLT